MQTLTCLGRFQIFNLLNNSSFAGDNAQYNKLNEEQKKKEEERNYTRLDIGCKTKICQFNW
jgi:hypothetical protein